MVLRVSIILLILLAAMTVLGCANSTGPSPTTTPTPTLAPTPSPTAMPNGSFTVIDYSATNPQYNTSYPIEMKTHGGNYSLYGKITINGKVPTGYVYHLRPSDYSVSNSNQAVDAIGILEVGSVSMSYSGTSGSTTHSGSSVVTLRSFVDPQGNYRIDGLNPGRMMFSSFRLFNASGNPDNSYHVGLVRVNLTKAVSRCDLDLTDLEFGYRTPDGFNLFTATGVLKNTDL